jgi:hypothetical protein
MKKLTLLIFFFINSAFSQQIPKSDISSAIDESLVLETTQLLDKDSVVGANVYTDHQGFVVRVFTNFELNLIRENLYNCPLGENGKNIICAFANTDGIEYRPHSKSYFSLEKMKIALREAAYLFGSTIRPPSLIYSMEIWQTEKAITFSIEFGEYYEKPRIAKIECSEDNNFKCETTQIEYAEKIKTVSSII